MVRCHCSPQVSSRAESRDDTCGERRNGERLDARREGTRPRAQDDGLQWTTPRNVAAGERDSSTPLRPTPEVSGSGRARHLHSKDVPHPVVSRSTTPRSPAAQGGILATLARTTPGLRYAPAAIAYGSGDITASGSRRCSRSRPSLARRSRSRVSATAVASRWVPLG